MSEDTAGGTSGAPEEKKETPPARPERARATPAAPSPGGSGAIPFGWLVVVILFVAATAWLGFQCTVLKGQVTDLQGALDQSQAAISSMKQAAESASAHQASLVQQLVDLANEHLQVAEAQRSSGNAAGAQASVMRARTFAEMASQLAGDNAPAELGRVQAAIGEMDAKLAPAAPEEPSATPEEGESSGEEGGAEGGGTDGGEAGSGTDSEAGADTGDRPSAM